MVSFFLIIGILARGTSTLSEVHGSEYRLALFLTLSQPLTSHRDAAFVAGGQKGRKKNSMGMQRWWEKRRGQYDGRKRSESQRLSQADSQSQELLDRTSAKCCKCCSAEYTHSVFMYNDYKEDRVPWTPLNQGEKLDCPQVTKQKQPCKSAVLVKTRGCFVPARPLLTSPSTSSPSSHKTSSR